MKVLDLRDATGGHAPVALHPEITLVRGLDPVHRAWLVDVLGRLAGGRDLPASGELEAHGIRFDLDNDSLTLLGLDQPVQAVVAAADLPGHDPAAAEVARTCDEATGRRDAAARELEASRSALADAVAARDEAVRRLDELERGEGAAREAIAAAAAERSRLEFELQAARDERDRNEELLARAINEREEVLAEQIRLQTRLDAARNRREAAIAAATETAGELEATRSVMNRTDDLAAIAEAAAARLAAAEAAAAEADPDRDDSPLGRRLADLERRRVELARLQAAIGDGASKEVAEALDGLLGASADAPPVVAALALADSWRDLHQQISALEAGVSPAERDAEKRLSAARQAVVEAEAEFNQPILTPEQISKVETSHSAVLEAQDRADSRFSGGRAKKRLDELRADERRVLERLGFSTYADYMMSSSSRGVGQANRAILDTARANLAAAEEHLGSLPGAGDRARRRVELLQRRDAVAPRVADLLGHEPTGPEAEDELRALREPVAADQHALDALADRLAATGVEVGPGPHDRDEVVLLARAYLAEESTAEAERNDVAKAIAALDGAIDDLRSARNRGETDPPDLVELPALARPVSSAEDQEDEAKALTLREARWAEVETARAAQAEAEADLARFQTASAQVEGLERALAEASRTEAVAAAEVEEAQAALGGEIEAQVATATDRVTQAEAALARSRSREQDVAAQITEGQGRSGSEALVEAAAAQVRDAEAIVAEVAGVEQTSAAALAEAESVLARALEVEAAHAASVAGIDRNALIEELEWELLARLAKVRSVGPGGSVPLVLDEPFSALHDDEVGPVLDRLAAIAGAVQVVVVSDRSAVAAWARGRAGERIGVHQAA